VEHDEPPVTETTARAEALRDEVIYQQAMETFRSILAQVVSTAGVFATGALAIIAVAVQLRSPALVGVSSIFPIAIYLLFRRWKTFDETVLSVAASMEVNGRPQLATSLRGWRKEAWFVECGPLLATGGLLIWAIGWWVKNMQS
jgi:hypothetical protein